MLRKYLSLLTFIVLIACDEPSNTPEPDTESNKDFVLVGDELINKSFEPVNILGNGQYWLNDTTVTDSLALDINSDGKADFMLVYQGDYKFNSSNELTGPVNEGVSLLPLDYIMLKLAYEYSDEIYTVFPFLEGDTLRANNNWQWLEKPTIFQRWRNGAIGNWDDYKYFTAYYKPNESVLGWFSYQMILDDYYIREVRIQEFGEFRIPTN